jgi:hypothetical protein
VVGIITVMMFQITTATHICEGQLGRKNRWVSCPVHQKCGCALTYPISAMRCPRLFIGMGFRLPGIITLVAGDTIKRSDFSFLI